MKIFKINVIKNIVCLGLIFSAQAYVLEEMKSGQVYGASCEVRNYFVDHIPEKIYDMDSPFYGYYEIEDVDHLK